MNYNYEVIYQDFVLIFIFLVREYSLTGIARVRASIDRGLNRREVSKMCRRSTKEPEVDGDYIDEWDEE